jgi:hypothetical protein
MDIVSYRQTSGAFTDDLAGKSDDDVLGFDLPAEQGHAPCSFVQIRGAAVRPQFAQQSDLTWEILSTYGAKDHESDGD